MLRDRSGDRFSVPVMALPPSADADGGPVRVMELAERVIEICDGLGRRRVIHYEGGQIVRMETTIVGARGQYERVDQKKGTHTFVSAFVEPGRMPRVIAWEGDVLVRVDRGLVNYVTPSDERLFETADGRVVQERGTRSGARIFVWFDRDGNVRSKQIHDKSGKRHLLAYDSLGLTKIRFHDESELTRGVYGLWETEDGAPVRQLELMEDGSIRWIIDAVLREVRGDGTSAIRVEHEDSTEFIRYRSTGALASSIRVSSDPTGAEKTVIRDQDGIVSIRIAAPRSDGGYDVRHIDRTRAGSQPTWRISNIAPPGKSPELDRLALLPTFSGDARYVVATIDDVDEGIVYSFPDETGMFLERTDGRIERVA